MNILLLSTDTDIVNAVEKYCVNNDHELISISKINDAEAELESHRFDAVLMDCSIRTSELIIFSEVISNALLDTVVLLIGPLDSNQREQLSRKLSAHYSIDKPLRTKAFNEIMGKVMKRAIIVRDAGLIGRSAVMEETVQTIMQIGPSPINVLLTGESGSGKEVIARAVHAVSLRAAKPFLAVNCAALAEGILESELFGHEKGSFTGASARRIGMFEQANRGTIFLDEIGEIPHSTQIRLLRVLEEREIMRVGGTEVIPVDVRVIAATNQNLESLVEEGRFRRDLYYRIKVLEITAPPLRKRPEDIPILVDRIARLYSLENDLPPRRFSDKAKDVLSRAPWTGNVRELRNVIESSLALTSSKIVGIDDIPSNLLRDINRHTTLPIRQEAPADSAERELIYRTLLDLKSDIREIKQFLFENRFKADNELRDPYMVEVKPLNEDQTEPTLEEIERQAIIDTLENTDGNRRLAAEMLGIGERTLYRKLKLYGLS